MRVFLLTLFALTAFAFNSILCRWALGSESIDAASFTLIRLFSGAIALFLIHRFRVQPAESTSLKGSWSSALALFVYAVFFSFAYNDLTAATGALILFGAVQLSMFGISLTRGENPKVLEWIGLAIAFAGLVYLVLPGLEAPPIIAAILMAVSGIAWGVYTIRGKGSEDALGETTGIFIRSVPFAVPVVVVFLGTVEMNVFGISMAALSGALTSGVGYAVWYSVLSEHSSARASVLQLSVPLIAAGGGIALLGESISMRFIVAGLLILGGIFAAVRARTS